MEHDYDDDVSAGTGLTAVKLSLVGGFVGTLAGLKRRGVGGAFAGGLLGGAAGYAAGAALDGPDTAAEWEDPLADVREDPVTVDVGSDDDGFDFGAGDEDETDEEGSEDESGADEADAVDDGETDETSDAEAADEETEEE